MDKPAASDTRRADIEWLLFLASSVVLAAMLFVQHSLAPGRIETTVRFSAEIFGFVGVPTFLALASRDWLMRQRPNLPDWRNGIALSSIVVISASWLVYWGILLMAWSGVLKHIASPDWIGLVLGSSFLGLVFSSAMRGKSRPYVISAALLMWAGAQAGIYF